MSPRPGARPRSSCSTPRTRKRTARRRAEKGEWTQAVGRSRGGRTPKIPCAAVLSTATKPLDALPAPRRLVADRAFDADRLRAWLRLRGTKPVIPSTASRNRPCPLDRRAYARRNAIERLFCRLKNWRRVATRYDRLASNHLAGLVLVALVTEWAK